MHRIVDNHPQRITSIYCRKLMATQRGDGLATIYSFRSCLFVLWLRLF